jgi:hypothetical protein
MHTTAASVRAVNLRDLADVLPARGGGGAPATAPTLRRGRVFRCSQLFSQGLLAELGVRTVVDLRGAAEVRRAARLVARKAPSSSAAAAAAAAGLRPLQAAGEGGDGDAAAVVAAAAASGGGGGDGGAAAASAADAEEVVAVPVEAAIAASSAAAAEPHEAAPTTTAAAAATTLQFDLLPPLQLAREALRRLPPSVWARAALRALALRDPRPVLSRALADDRYVGLARWNRAVLAGAGPSLGAALRALTRPDALPALVHCAQGKDRTALVCSLLLALSGVPDDAIAADYSLSERELRRYRQSLSDEQGGDPDAAAGNNSPRGGDGGGDDDDDDDDAKYERGDYAIPLSEMMIAAHADVALAVLRELRERYGGAEAYLLRQGRMTRAEVAALKRVLVVVEEEGEDDGGAAGAAGQAAAAE